MGKAEKSRKGEADRLTKVLKSEAFGLVGALWLYIGSQAPSTRPAFMVFGIVTVGLSLANLWMLGEWKFRKSSG